MKILIADKIAPSGIDFLRAQDGFEVIEAFGSSTERLLELVSDVDAIIVRSATEITKEVIAAAKQLKAVGRAGVGVDNVDVDAATQRGVVVMNTPDGNTIATAELTFTHLLSTARPLPQANASMKSGKWDKKSFTGAELHKKILGIIGLGRIGSEVAKRANAFGMTVLAYDPYLTRERAEALEVQQVELDQLFEQADFITVHMPKTDVTHHMIDESAFEKMKPGLRIVNCARGGLIKEDALVSALRSGKVAAAGFDVFEVEPLPEESSLRSFDNLVMTPHLGASTTEAQESVGIQVAEAIVEMLKGGMVRNAVNMPTVDPANLRALRPYLQLGERLGAVLQQLSPSKVSRINITYWGKIVELDTMPLTRSIQRGYLRRIAGAEVNDVNAPHCLKRLGVEVQTTKSGETSDYTELVRVESIGSSGERRSVEGTLIGSAQKPRIVAIDSREVEASPAGTLLLIEHRDVLGIVGMLGTVLARHQVNIANMSLSRTVLGGTVLTLLELDSEPGEEALTEIRKHEAVAKVETASL